MISLEDCAALCGLTAEEITAIAEHEHVPDIEAMALAQTLLGRAHGDETLRDMIVDDIRCALHDRDLGHACRLLAALRHFLKEHPHAQTGELDEGSFREGDAYVRRPRQERQASAGPAKR